MGAVAARTVLCWDGAWATIRRWVDRRGPGWVVEAGIRYDGDRAGEVEDFVRARGVLEHLEARRPRGRAMDPWIDVYVELWPGDPRADEVLQLIEHLGGRWTVRVGLLEEGAEPRRVDLGGSEVRDFISGREVRADGHGAA